LTFNGLHGVLSQKTELVILTASRTSDPKRNRKIEQGNGKALRKNVCVYNKVKRKAIPVTGRGGP
jgi:hypothetical protein